MEPKQELPLEPQVAQCRESGIGGGRGSVDKKLHLESLKEERVLFSQ
jgi:hypothetical protein